jgi:uncharacterized protein (DUF1015 family)
MNHLARPFAALRPRQDTAQAVIAPPYDVVDTEEARALAEGRPESFLHISRPEIDLPAGTNPYDEAVYATGARNLEQLIRDKVLERESTDCYYIYRMRDGSHEQTGIACAASIDAYKAGLIHAHELTRPDKENDRVRNIEALNAQTGPVMLAYKANTALDGMLERLAQAEPLFTATGQHEVVHTIWRVADDADIAELTRLLDGLGDLYIADGHHRSAAAARVAAARQGQAAGGNAGHDYFLSVAFPDDQMRIFDYNRVVADLNGLSGEAFLAAIRQDFEVEEVEGQARPERAQSFGMYLEGRWYRLQPKRPPDGSDPVASLDVSILQSGLVAPILGIGDPRTDDRIAFVGGVRGLDELERRVDSGRAAAAFALYPTGIRDLMAVADAGLLMPPKSTWFEPKLADGLLTHVLDQKS